MMKVVVVLYLLVQCTLPVISGKTSPVDVTKEDGKVLSKSNSLRDSIPNTNVKGHGGEDEIVENWKLDPSQATPPKLFTAYKETYITKAAAKKFLQKIRSLKKPYTDKEYDDLLQEIVLEPKPTSKYSIYDKKYFDYLPSDQQEAKLDQEPTQQPHHRHHGHKRRSKRNADTEEEKKVTKRHSGAWSRHFLEHERRHYEHLRRVEEERNRRYSQHYQPVVYSNDIYVPVSADPTNPWNNPFYRPRLNNYYLPPDPSSQFVVHPQQTFIGYPIPGVVYNVPFPPQNPPVNQVTQPPTTTPPKPTEMPPQVQPEVPPEEPERTMTRFGEEDDQPPVWDVVEKPSRLIPERPSQAQPTTRRPTVPLIRDNEDYYDDLTESNKIPQANVNQGVQSTTRRPSPPLIRDNDYYDDMTSNSGRPQRPPSQTNSNQLGSGSAARPRPLPATPATPIATRPTQPEGPSRCVWAIVNCCTPRNPAVRYACFERVGCHGVFWDLNPCSDVVVQAAVDETNRYFN
ncbi:uncharacterized protein LOC129787218 isoform X2 [Lutzomyia longipalpis]|uniref:uncharacterized protein LOC129787218 isoform X2 n=1 Tax=Lutzomyia longipalpis TaxID=7200 RepID=UPI0024842876|nr:uncharacterized protein LOC129787218 isoform X2 [Lutzomyia longipalpis]XP_055678590.1 uncharacterized protein LOC129787218 isoform X2 [Lutzomyia longipalpis]